MLIRVRKNVHATCLRQGKLGYQTPAQAEQMPDMGMPDMGGMDMDMGMGMDMGGFDDF